MAGLMGAVATSSLEAGGRVHGVIPRAVSTFVVDNVSRARAEPSSLLQVSQAYSSGFCFYSCDSRGSRS